MPNNSTYTVAGISFYRGQWRLRTSNNLAERQKTLMAMGDTDINLIELPRAMSKTEIVRYLTGHLEFDTEEEQALLTLLRTRWGLHSSAAQAQAAAQTQTAQELLQKSAAQQQPLITDATGEPDF
jgi:hypothetical protein